MSSTTEEWAKTARTLFDNRRYMQAVHCYERAGMPREKHIAFSYYLREQARSLPVHRRIVNPIRMAAFLRAADSFHEAAEKATKTSERHAYYRIAAEGFAEVGDNRRAAEEYLFAAEYARSAQHYRKAALFDEAVAVAQSHKKEIPVAVAESIITVARIHYFRENYLEYVLNYLYYDC